jgi:hypothetical protein
MLQYLGKSVELHRLETLIDRFHRFPRFVLNQLQIVNVQSVLEKLLDFSSPLHR